MVDPTKCPLCVGFDQGSDHPFSVRHDHKTEILHCECARCGSYGLHFDLFDDSDGLRKASEDKLLLLSKLARQATTQKPRLQLTWENWEDFDHARVAPSPSSYYESVLLELAARCKYPGRDTGAFRLAEAAAVCQLPERAMSEIADQLSHAKWLKVIVGDPLRFKASLTIEGWQRIDKLTLRRDPSRRAFVAMWFDSSMDPAYKAIAAMLEGEGYRPPFRVDDPAHDGTPAEEQHSRIDDRILAEIRGSRFVLADFTGNRQAVYFEAGFAEGLGIPIVWSCREGEDFKALNFDTRQHEHIKWKDEPDLAAQLQAKIRRKGWSWTR